MADLISLQHGGGQWRDDCTTKYYQEIIELEKAIKILAEEIREMKRKETEAFKKNVPDVDKEEYTKACKVETVGIKMTKKKRKKKKRKKKKKKAIKKGRKNEKDGNLNNRLDADSRKADVDISGVNMKEEKELDDRARNLVVDALHAARKLEAKLIIADVVNNAVTITLADHEEQMMSTHASVIVDNAIKGGVNAMTATQKKYLMDATAEKIADDAIRGAVNDVKDEKETNEMDGMAKGIVDSAIKGAVTVMQIEKEKNEMDGMAKGIVDSAIKGAVKVIQIEEEKTEIEVRAKIIVDAALKGAVKVIQIEKEKKEMDARAKVLVDAAIKGDVNTIQIEKEKNEMTARAKILVDAAIKVRKEGTKINKVHLKVGAANKVNDGATEIDAGVDNGNVIGAMLGKNGYDHRRIHVQVVPEKFTEKERIDICQYWSEKLGIATTTNMKLHRDVTYFGRM